MRLVLVFLLAVALAAMIWFSLPDAVDPPAPPAPETAPDHALEEFPAPDAPGQSPKPDSGPGAIEGTVTRDGKPVAARISLLRLGEEERMRIDDAPSRVLAVTDAGEDGRFEFRNVSSGPREVVAVAGDGARGRAFVYPPRTGIAALVHVEISGEGLSFRVVATYADGRPFAGEIALAGWTDHFPERDPSYECWREDYVPAGTDGSATFTDLSPGLVRPLARIRGTLAVRGPPVRLPREKAYRFVVDRGFREVSGRVVADETGDPVGRASIRSEGDNEAELDDGVVTRATAGNDGRFSIRVPETCRRIDVRAEGFRPGHAKTTEESTELVVRLRRPPEMPEPWTITGRVIHRDDGAPVRGAAVLATYASGSSVVPARATSDDEGRFTLTSQRGGDLLLIVLGGGWVSPLLARQGELSLEPLRIQTSAGERYERELMAIPCGKARVLVLGGNEAPVAGVAVTASLAGNPRKSQMLWRGLARSIGKQEVTTGGDGVAMIEHLPPGCMLSLAATPPSGFAIAHWQRTPTTGETAEVTIRIPTYAVREVRFIFEDDRAPVAGATVRIWTVGKSTVNGFWMTDSTGLVKIGPIPPGEALARLEHPEAVLLPEGPGPSVVTVHCGRTYGGSVLMPDGAPAVEAYVSASVYTDAEGERDYTVRADADGRFLLRGVPEGEIVQLRAGFHRDGRLWRGGLQEVRPGALDHVLRLEVQAKIKPRPKLVVTVLGPGGKPATGGKIRTSLVPRPREGRPAGGRRRNGGRETPGAEGGEARGTDGDAHDSPDVPPGDPGKGRGRGGPPGGGRGGRRRHGGPPPPQPPGAPPRRGHVRAGRHIPDSGPRGRTLRPRGDSEGGLHEAGTSPGGGGQDGRRPDPPARGRRRPHAARPEGRARDERLHPGAARGRRSGGPLPSQRGGELERRDPRQRPGSREEVPPVDLAAREAGAGDDRSLEAGGQGGPIRRRLRHHWHRAGRRGPTGPGAGLPPAERDEAVGLGAV